MKYVPNTMGIKEKTDLENALMGVHQIDETASGALVDLGDLSAGNMDAIIEIGEIVAEVMNAIAELGEVIAYLDARITALENN